MSKITNQTAASMDNIYTLDGKVPLLKSIPFGLQHVLAMFVANIAPIMIVTGASGLSTQETAALIQTAMIMAGIGTLVQLFTVWKLGAKLPIVMGISFTFVSVFCYVGPQWGYEAIIGAVLIGGIISSLSACFGCMPITSFSQNVGLLAMTKVVNRYTIATGAGILLLAGIFPAFGAVLATLPEAVLGGCTIMMFGNIVISGLQMIGSCGFTQRNITIAALSLSIGLGFTQVPDMFNIFPTLVRTIFAENCVAVVFLAAILMNLIMPKDGED